MVGVITIRAIAVMARILSTAAYQAIHAQQTGDAALLLLTIDIPGGNASAYLTDNSEDVVSRGKTFIAYPFALELPSDENGNISEARLSIDNVSRTLVDEIRNFSDPLILTIEVVFSSTPDVVEYIAEGYAMGSVSYDALTISGTLTQENMLNEPYPKDIMSAASFPGQF